MSPTSRTQKRWPWLLAALVLLGAGAWLMAGAEPPPKVVKTVALPRHMREAERNRNDTRQTWFPLPQVDDAGLPLPPPPSTAPRDPVLAAMPATVKYGAMVIEANAIRNSELGDMLVDCLFSDRPETLDFFRDAGFDPLSSVDRISVADDTLMVSGNFGSTDVGALLKPESSQQWGSRSTLYRMGASNGGRRNVAGVWNGQMLVLGANEEEVKATLDRLDGKGVSSAPLITSNDAYGEIYGALTGEGLARFVDDDNEALAKVISETASKVRLHADVGHDVGLVADLNGSDPKKTDELRKSLASALTMARLKAKAEGKSDELSVLDMARVGGADEGTAFRLEAGLPYSFLENSLTACAKNGRERREKRMRGQAVPVAPAP